MLPELKVDWVTYGLRVESDAQWTVRQANNIIHHTTYSQVTDKCMYEKPGISDGLADGDQTKSSPRVSLLINICFCMTN